MRPSSGTAEVHHPATRLVTFHPYQPVPFVIPATGDRRGVEVPSRGVPRRKAVRAVPGGAELRPVARDRVHADVHRSGVDYETVVEFQRGAQDRRVRGEGQGRELEDRSGPGPVARIADEQLGRISVVLVAAPGVEVVVLHGGGVWLE